MEETEGERISRRERKEEAKKMKRKRIEEAGGVRPRTNKKNNNNNIDKSKQKKKSKPASSKNNSSQNTQQQQQQQQQRHRFGRVMEVIPSPNKPRRCTLSIAIPGSVVTNAQTRELRTQLVGQFARAAAVYHVDEIVVFDDKLSTEMKDRGSFYRSSRRKDHHSNHSDRKTQNDKNDASNATAEGKDHRDRDSDRDRETHTKSDPHAFMARILQFCECPQYLRRHFFPMHPDLQFAGLLPPLDAPHHVRTGERSKYREGVVLEGTGNGPDAGSLVNCGIRGQPVEIDKVLTPGIRCTVQIDPKAYGRPGRIKGKVVSPTAPREEDGTYWGYSTRLAHSINAIFDECPYTDAGYDLKIGTSERGTVTVDDDGFSLPSFRHSIIVFGGVAGIEECVDADETLTLSGERSMTLFDMWVNTCPFQGSRTIRSEEAVLISLARFRPHIFKNKEPSKVLSDDASSTNSKLATVDVKFSDSEPSDESSSSSSSEED